VRGQVVFAMPPSMAELLGADLVQKLAEQAPLIRLRIVEAFSAAARGWLESEKIDLGMLYDLGPLRHLNCRRLASDELFLIGASGRFGSFVEPTSLPLSDLVNERIAAPGPQHGLHQVIAREAAKAGVDIQIQYEIDSLGTIRNLIQRGFCTSILPYCAVAELAGTDQVSVARINNGDLRRTLSLVRNPSHVLTHASIRVEAVLLKIMVQKISENAWHGRLEIE
jgi:LysR family transcriptional regulator, nitrogen assimilation regulatory protein